MVIGRETERVEFKKTTSELNEAIIDICAILNKHGQGELYFGVKNDGEVCGLSIGDSTERDISRKIFEKIRPQIYPTIELKNIDNENVIKVTFIGSSKPYSADGKYYMRVADESRELTPQELSILIMNSFNQDFERLCSNDTIDDVDENILKFFFKLAINSKRLNNMVYDKVILLRKLDLLYMDDVHLNNAGRLLFSKNMPIKLKLATLVTPEKRTFIDMKIIDGNIFELIQTAQKYVEEHINWSIKIDGLTREDIPEIPIEALREIIVNSFAHANYYVSSYNEIDIYPNRVAIYNPGAFPDNVTPLDYINNNLSSKIRNKIICNVLYLAKIIESFGTGLKRTYELCDNENIDISYEKEYDGFWFFFSRKNNNITDYVSDLSKIEKIVLEEIRKNPQVTRDGLSNITKRNSRTMQRVLDSLKSKNIIKRVGANRNGYWEEIKK